MFLKSYVLLYNFLYGKELTREGVEMLLIKNTACRRAYDQNWCTIYIEKLKI